MVTFASTNRLSYRWKNPKLNAAYKQLISTCGYEKQQLV